MTVYINRSQDGKEKILTDEAIDLINDAIESLLFKEEFFKASPWNTVKVSTAWLRAGEEDINIISCHGDGAMLTEDEAKFLHSAQSYELGSYFEAIENLSDDSVAIVIGGCYIRGVYLVTGILRVEDKAIFLLGSCRGAEEFETLSHSMCGLTHVVFRLLTTSHTSPPIEMGEVVDKITNDAIAKRVASWFTSGRESVQKWEASL